MLITSCYFDTVGALVDESLSLTFKVLNCISVNDTRVKQLLATEKFALHFQVHLEFARKPS